MPLHVTVAVRSHARLGCLTGSPSARRGVAAVFLWLFCALSGADGASAQTANAEPGAFDHYILALSWSPTHCAESDRNRGSEQCRERHDTILHGLWPQYERGWPEYCATDYPTRLPAQLLDAYDAMTPDRGLLAHQWRKHGTCTGLSPEDYFDTAYALWSRVRMPPALDTPRSSARFDRADLRARIVAANPDIDNDRFILTCDGPRLDEIRICLSRDGAYRRCGRDVLSKRCRHNAIMVLPPNGG